MPSSTEDKISSPQDVLNKLSTALTLISRGDPITALRSELQTKFDAIETRFAGIDKATELQHDDLVRVPTQVDRQINGLREVLEQQIATAVANVNGRLDTRVAETQQKFSNIDDRFTERDTRTDQQASDTKLAVDAAFAAAKEATAKVEGWFTKQIDGMSDLIDTKTENLANGLSEVKDRLTIIESRTQGITQQRSESNLSTTQHASQAANIAAIVFGVIGMLVGVGSLVVALSNRPAPPPQVIYAPPPSAK